MKPCPYPVETLVPHAHPMILIDDILGYEQDCLMASVTIRPGVPFFVEGRGVAAHIAIEWMAQSCAALIGVQALDACRKVRLGFLLGTRNFSAAIPWFRTGERLIVTVSLVFHDTQMGVFDCVVARDLEQATLAKAQLTTYQPEDATMLVERQGMAKSGSGA